MAAEPQSLLRRLVRPGRKALQIGLGIGTAAAGLAQHGVTVDVIELHQEVGEPDFGTLHPMEHRSVLVRTVCKESFVETIGFCFAHIVESCLIPVEGQHRPESYHCPVTFN